MNAKDFGLFLLVAALAAPAAVAAHHGAAIRNVRVLRSLLRRKRRMSSISMYHSRNNLPSGTRMFVFWFKAAPKAKETRTLRAKDDS